MGTQKTEKIFELLCELPLEKWQPAKVSNNYTTTLNGIQIYLEYHDKITAIVYLDEQYSFSVDNHKVALSFRDKLRSYFEDKKKQDNENKINELYNKLIDSICGTSKDIKL